MNKSLFFVFLISLNAFGLGACRSDSRITLSGTLELTEHSLGARVPGRISKIHFDEGSEVKKGDLLATLDRYEQAKKDDDRIKRLFEKGGSTQQAVEQADLALEDQAVVSPVDGVVLTKVHDSGEVVTAGGSVAVVGDRTSAWIRIFVPEGFVNRIRMGQEASVAFDGLDHPFPGKIVFIAPKAEFTPRNVQSVEERVTQTFSVKVALDPLPVFLRPGVAADVTLTLSDGTR